MRDSATELEMTVRLIPGRIVVAAAVWLLVSLFLAPVARGGQSSPVAAEAFVNGDPVPAGGGALAAVRIDIAAHYHIQASRPYDPNLKAAQLKVAAGAGIQAGAPRYPAWKDIQSAGLSDQPKLAVYEGTVYILLPLQIAKDAAVGPHTLNLTLRYQACDETSCLPPTSVDLPVQINVATAGATATSVHPEIFAAAGRQSFAEDFAAPLSPPSSAPASSAPATAPAVRATSALPQDVMRELAAIAGRDYQPRDLGGEAPVRKPWWQLVLFALVGGAILNIFPCVLPVIPLKILTLIQHAHGDRRLAVIHGLFFSAGVISLFVTLAILLAVLHGAGGSGIYGSQFQNPVYLISLSMIILALSLSMMGVWTIQPPRALYQVDQAREGYLGSFMMGVLATLLATPCSAPYLGTVIAAALSQPVFVTILFFALVGVGMSIPYVLLTAFPAGLDRLPKAGRWSELLKQGLGFLMLGVAVYLILRLPTSYWPWTLAAAVVLGFVCWAWGQIPTPNMQPANVWAIRATAVAVGGGLCVVLFILAGRAEGGWQPFSVAALDAALAQKQVVVVDWTANWCTNCQVVDARVLRSEKARADFKAHRVVLLRADLSESNPVAEAMLSKLGSRAIPVLAVFPPARPYQPVVLRDLYTREDLSNALEDADSAAAAR